MNVFRSFFALMLEMLVRCDNQYDTGADRENILGQPVLFVCMGIFVLSPAHESEMMGYLVYVLIVKKPMSLILFKFSHSILDWTVLSWNFWGFLETFIEGSVDHIIYRDYIVNRRFIFTVVCPQRSRSGLTLPSIYSHFPWPMTLNKQLPRTMVWASSCSPE